jgi:hypothetical protein
MGEACGTYGGEENYVPTGLWRGNLTERDRLENLGVDGENNIKMDLKEIG